MGYFPNGFLLNFGCGSPQLAPTEKPITNLFHLSLEVGDFI